TGSKPKPQRVFITALTSHWMEDDFDVTIAKRLTAWYGAAAVPHDLKVRWTSLISLSVTVAPSWRWITLRTLAGGWHTSSRMHVTPEVDQCRLGCHQQPDAIAHYLVCDQLQHLVRLPRTFSQATVLERLGLGCHYPEHGEHSLSMTIQRLVLSYHTHLEHHLGARLAALDRLNITK
ncbi:unnamed protein product, partial [Prorocentrum cordatum]